MQAKQKLMKVSGSACQTIPVPAKKLLGSLEAALRDLVLHEQGPLVFAHDSFFFFFGGSVHGAKSEGP